ncbi:protein kinase, partial [Myxococcota bacterium]|nr:protein kinase [Myxococcota bacterium]
MAGSFTRSGVLVAGRFMLERELGRGAAATVWRARDLDDGRSVAVKLFDREYLEAPHARARIEREASVLRALSHPNIARAIDVGVEAEQPYVALELVEGSTLDDVLIDRAASRRVMAPAEVAGIMRQLVAAIGHAHERRVVHRDLKPSNVMLLPGVPAPTVKVVDFGVAKLLDLDSHAVTTQGRFIGTLIYMAPEQLLTEGIDERVDVFAVGAILFELLTLRRTWVLDLRREPASFADPIEIGRPNSFSEVIERILGGDRPRPSDFAAATPALDAVVARALARSKTERFASIDALGAALSPALDEWVEAHAPTATRGPRAETATVPEITTLDEPPATDADATLPIEPERPVIAEPIAWPPDLPDEAPRVVHRPIHVEQGRRRPLLGAVVFLVLATIGTVLSIERNARRLTPPPSEPAQ